MSNSAFFQNLTEFALKNSDKKVVLAGGCFDVLHPGHIEFLRFAKNQGDTLVIALEGDEFITKRKKRIPVHGAFDRKKILEAIRFVDHVILLPFFTSHEEYAKMVETIHPAVIVCTEGDPQLTNKAAQAKSIGAQLSVCPHLSGFSTTKILDYRSH